MRKSRKFLVIIAVARQTSSTETVLVSSTDDYGTTLYFRGAVTNNFVKDADGTATHPYKIRI